MAAIERHSTAWYDALDAHVSARRDALFAWGAFDCITFAADWVRTARGVDPLEDRRVWASARDAAQALAAAGGIRAAIESRMGPAVPGPMAQAGDVVLVRHSGDRLSAGVCTGTGVAAPSDSGLVFVAITEAEAAWRV